MNYKTKLLFLQVAFGLLFLTFGIGKIVEPAIWIGLVPPWAKTAMPLSADVWMQYAAYIEIVLGIWLVLPIKQHLAALVAFLYYIPWAVMGGMSYMGVKDIVLCIVLLGLTLLSWPKEFKLAFDE